MLKAEGGRKKRRKAEGGRRNEKKAKVESRKANTNHELRGNKMKMKTETIKKYLLNCLLLMVPIILWNVFLIDKLPHHYQPDLFWKDIPVWLKYGENISRVLVFMLTMLMPLRIYTVTQKRGLILYGVGVIVYFASWLVLIYCPDSGWSSTISGFMAPAYTPLLWLTGIGLIGNSFYFNLPYRRWVFILISVIFLVFHNWHTLIVFFRTVM